MARGKYISPDATVGSSPHPYKDMVHRWGVFTQDILTLSCLNIVISCPRFCLVMLETIQLISKATLIMALNVILDGIPDLVKLVLLVIHIGQQNQELDTVGIIVIQQLF